MPIHIVCPRCGTDYDVSDDLRGILVEVRCRSCNQSIPVPAASGIKRDEPPARKSAAPSRRREDDEDRRGKSGAPVRRREKEDDEACPRKSDALFGRRVKDDESPPVEGRRPGASPGEGR